MLHKQGMNWAYMNSILKNWHAKGLHSVAAIETGDRPARPGNGQSGMVPGTTPRPEQDDRAKARMERLRRKMEQQRQEETR